jgi:hypothetical protein
MEFSKYIVPIYSNDKFSGTGFIVGGLLITANHVVKNKINSFFIFEGKHYKIEIRGLISLEFPDDFTSPNYAYDLFICKTDIENSDLFLSEDYNKDICCQYYGYSYDEKRRMIIVDKEPEIKISRDEALTKHYGQYIPLHNCLSCYSDLRPGNSGGPLFQNGNIIGMLLQGDIYHEKCIECKFLKASYVMKAIVQS